MWALCKRRAARLARVSAVQPMPSLKKLDRKLQGPDSLVAMPIAAVDTLKTVKVDPMHTPGRRVVLHNADDLATPRRLDEAEREDKLANVIRDASPAKMATPRSPRHRLQLPIYPGGRCVLSWLVKCL